MDALSGLIVYGPLGIWATASTIAIVHLYRGAERLRDEHAKTVAAMVEEHVNRLKVVSDEHAKQLHSLSTAHAESLRHQADRYDRQVAEMQQRSFTIVGTLTEKLSNLADSLSRHRRS